VNSELESLSVKGYLPVAMDIHFRQNESDFPAAQTARLIRHPLAIGRSIIPMAMLGSPYVACELLASEKNQGAHGD
jgi:hypothetical protein